MPERQMSAPTIDRGRRCQNCKHWDNGALAIQHYKVKRFAELQARALHIFSNGGPVPVGLTGQRLGDDDIHSPKVGGKRSVNLGFEDMDRYQRMLGLNYELGDTLMRNGQMGMCRVAASPGDFTQLGYLCGDQGPCRYEASVVVDGAEKPDETAGEARSRLGLD